MIIEFFLNVGVVGLCKIMDGFSLGIIPVDVIHGLTTFIAYGVHIVGADVMLAIFGSIMSWISIRCSVGLVVFIWKLLPLT